MSTMFLSKEQALQRGFYFAGRRDLKNLTLDEILKHNEIRQSDRVLIGLDGEDLPNQTVIEFPNEAGKIATMGTSSFRGGYDLWLVGEGKICVRV